MLKHNFKYSLDDPKRTLEHRKLIKEKKFLRKLYNQWYAEFVNEYDNLPLKKVVELGSGGGFLKELLPDVICSDYMDLPDNDLTFSALDMPFDDKSLGGIFMVDTLHHIPDMEQFLREATRVLTSGAKIIMIEPANSTWGRFIYTNFHHEPFDTKGSWTIPSTGPLSGANGALPWIVFERDKGKFSQLFPNFKIELINYRNPLLYLLSGGVSRKQLLPDFMYPVVNAFDGFLPKISKQISMFQIIKIQNI